MNNLDLNIIKKILIDAAKNELLPRYKKVCHEHKMDGSLVTEADLNVQNFIEKSLLAAFPHSVVLGEEMLQKQQSHLLDNNQAVWCLDPIDGTSNFAFGIPYFAISLALIENGKVILGVVYDPIRKEMFIAIEGRVELNDKPIRLTWSNLELKQATAIIDFKRLTKALATKIVSNTPFASQRNFGASALDWCWLALGRGHVYLHGSQNIWDYAAGHFIFEQCGGVSQTLEGESIFKYKLEKRSVVAAVDLNLFKQWSNWIMQ